MSRAKDGKRRAKQFQRLNGHNATAAARQQTKKSFADVLPLDIQISMALRGLDRLAGHVAELGLMIEFTMRNIIISRPKAGGLIIGGGKPEVERTSMLGLYEQHREQFAAQLMEERRAIARAQQAAKSGDGTGTSTSPATSGNGAVAPDPSLADVGDDSPGPLIFPGRES